MKIQSIFILAKYKKEEKEKNIKMFGFKYVIFITLCTLTNLIDNCYSINEIA